MPDDHLTSWDRELLRRFLPFYRSLHDRRRKPATEAQRHFISVLEGKTKPRTQHEIAYTRYLRVNASGKAIAGLAATTQPAPEANQVIPTPKMIKIVERIEEDEASLDASSPRFRVLESIKNIYKRGQSSARRYAEDAALWSTTILSEGDIGGRVTAWLSDAYGGVSNAYTQGMDGAFAEGLKSGAVYVSDLALAQRLP